MDDLVTILFIAVFVLAPLIEQIRRRSKGGAAPPRRQAPEPEGRLPAPYQRTPARSQPQGASARPAPGADEAGGDRSAATMLPEDLWEVLTGQRPAPTPARVPPRQPDDVLEAEDEDVGAVDSYTWDDEAVAAEPATVREARSLEVDVRPDYPVVVSLEEIPPAAIRHERFHQKIDKPASPAMRIGTRGGLRPGLRLNERSEIRRAMVLREVLGPPKGLE